MKRQLTGFEKAFCLSDPPVPLNFAMVIQFTQAPPISELKAALLQLDSHYRCVGLRLVVNEQMEFVFTDEEVPDIPLRIIDDFQGKWQDVAVEELGTLFDLGIGPLVRTALVQHEDGSGELVLAFHHGIADGMSGVYFLQDLLSLLADPAKVLVPLENTDDFFERIPLKQKDKIQLRMQRMVMSNALRFMNILQHWKVGFPPADRWIENRRPWQHIALTVRQLDPEKTKALVAKCKVYQTTVYGAICAAWLLAKTTWSGKLKKAHHWKVSVPVDLRGSLGYGKSFGMIMSNVVVTIPPSSEDHFWEIARKMKSELTKVLVQGKVYQWISVMHGMMNLPVRLIKNAVPSFAVKPTGYDFSISNLGRLRINDNEPLRVYGPIVNTSEQELTVGVSTAQDHLSMVFCFRDYILSTSDGEKMADLAIEILQNEIGF
jgi:NRPS condensation-like uncharacterized protein